MSAGGRGVLLLSHEPARAAEWILKGFDSAFHRVQDRRGFNTVLQAPDLSLLEDWWDAVVLLDGDLLPGEAAFIRSRCPSAAIYANRSPNALLPAILERLCLDRETLGRLYTLIARGGRISGETITLETGLDESQIHTGLTALAQAGLINYTRTPWSVSMLPRPVRKLGSNQSPVNSPILRYLRQAGLAKPAPKEGKE